METAFFCIDCKQHKPVQKDGGTGYACVSGSDDKVCYECVANRDKQYMVENNRITLYLTQNEQQQWFVGNWPDSLKFRAYVKSGKHNMAGIRYDAWFTDANGERWHGTQYGYNTQLIHCKKLKRAA